MLVGVIHLPALPGSPKSESSVEAICVQVAEEAAMLASFGFEACIVENFGDVPFHKSQVPPVTVAAMSLAVKAVVHAAPQVRVGVNVLRNDGMSAVSIAHAAGAHFIRINIHSGARVTDQGVIESQAADVLRLRRNLGASVDIWADVDVKHSVPLGASQELSQEVHDVVERGMASAVIVTGLGTGQPVSNDTVKEVHSAAQGRPVLIGSGATVDSLAGVSAWVDGVIVGSALRANGKAGAPLEKARCEAFAKAYRRVFNAKGKPSTK